MYLTPFLCYRESAVASDEMAVSTELLAWAKEKLGAAAAAQKRGTGVLSFVAGVVSSVSVGIIPSAAAASVVQSK